MAESGEGQDVGEEARGLGRVQAELALVAGHSDVRKLRVSTAEILKLPDTGRAAGRYASEVLKTLNDRHAPVASALGILRRGNGANAEMNKFMSFSGLPSLPVELQVGDPPWVSTIPDWRRPGFIRPSRPRPRGARW